MRHVAVVGASLAGWSAARALRAQGFDGRLTVVGAEPHQPYDRPPLSKDFLAGDATAADLTLERDDEDLGAHWRFGVTATQLDPSTTRVELSDGTCLTVDGVVVATGARARRLGPALRGVHVLRTLDDSLALRDDLVPGARLVVIGAGFIGAEVASTASRLGVEVTVLEAAAAPLAGALGDAMGARVASLHARHGVTLRCGVAVSAPVGTDRVTGVELADGPVLPADVVVVGIGVVPDVEWLHSSGLDVTNGVVCNDAGATSVPNVVAVGDCAAWLDPRTGSHRRTEHWTAASERPATAVATLLAGAASPGAASPGGAPRRRPEYFWSDQYGVRIQFAGTTRPGDDVRVEVGDVDSASFLAVYRRAGDAVAVLGLDQVREFGRWRRQLVP